METSKTVKPDNMPYFRIDHSGIERILFNLNEYISPMNPGEQDKSELEKVLIK